MTKAEYLDMRGFNEKDYALMTKDELGNLSEKPGAINNMYAANDPKGKTFGPGAYVVKRSWAEEHMKVSSPEVPPAPPTPPVEKEESDISKFLSIRIANLVKKGWEDQPEIKALTYKQETLPYSELEELANSDYTKLIISLDKKEEEPKPIEKQIAEFLCLNNMQSGQDRCKEQCGYCEAQQKIKDASKEEVKEEPVKEEPLLTSTLESRIEQFLEMCTTWRRKDDILTNGGLQIKLSDIDDMDSQEYKRFLNNSILQEELLSKEETVKEEPKPEPKPEVKPEPIKEEPKPEPVKEEPVKVLFIPEPTNEEQKKIKEELIKVPTADSETIDSFKEFGKLANIFQEAQQSLFVISQIKELLNSREADSDSGLSDGEILDKIFNIIE